MADERREVVAVITADARELRRGLNKATADARGDGRKLGQQLRLSVKQGFGSLGDIIGIGSAAGLVAAGKQVFEFQKRLTRLQITSGKTRGDMLRLQESIFRVSKARGLDPDSLLGGAEKFTEKTGNLKAFVDALDQLGAVGAATGAEMTDIAATAAAMSQSLGVGSEDMGKAFDVLAMGGKKGSVELRNFAGLMAELAPQMAIFGSKGTEAVAELSALLQMTATGFSSAEEAGTGLRALMDALIRQSKTLKKDKYGHISVFEKDGKKLRPLKDIIFDIGRSKLVQQPKLLQEALGGRGEAFRGLLAIMQTIGGKSAKERFDDLANIGDALGTNEGDARTWQDSPAGQMASAQAKLAETFNSAFVDTLDDVAASMSQIATALGFASRHATLLIAALAAAKLGPGLQALLGAGFGIEDIVDAGGGGGGGGGRKGKGKGRKARLPEGSGSGALLALGVGIEAGNMLNDATESLTGDTASGWLARGANALVPASTFSGVMDPVAAQRDAQFGAGRGMTTDKILNAKDKAIAARRRSRNMDLVGDPTAGGTGALVDLQNNAQQVNEAVMGALIEGLADAAARSSMADKDRMAASAARSAAIGPEAAAALQSAIGETGSGAFFESNPELLAAMQSKATAAAGANPLAGAGEAGLIGVIMELTREIQALRQGADARAILESGTYGGASSAIDDQTSVRHRRR